MNNTYLRYLVLPIMIFYLVVLTPHPSWAEEKGFSRPASQEPLILPPQEEGKIIPQGESISKPFYTKWWFWTLVLVIGGGAAAAAGGGGGGGSNTGGGSTTSTTGSVGVTW